MATATTTSCPVEPPAAPTASSTYRDFVREFMGKVDKTKYPSGRERMVLCAEAWRSKTGKPAGASAASKTSEAGVSKKQSKKQHFVFPVTPVSFKDIGGIFTSGQSTVGDSSSSETKTPFSRAVAFQVQRTKKAHKTLKNTMKSFQSDLKHGKVLSLDHAFTAGFNAFLDLARPT